MAGTMAETGKNKEQTLQNAINGLKAFDEPYNMINNKLSPSKNPNYEDFLTTKGYTFFFPDTENAKAAATDFAKTLKSLGYDAVVIREQNIDGETYSYMLHVGKRAAEQIAKKEAKAPMSPEAKRLADNLAAAGTAKLKESESKEVRDVLKGGKPPSAKERAELEEQVSGAKPEEKKKPAESVAGIVPTAPEKQAKTEQEVAKLQKELEAKLAILRENAAMWGDSGRSKIAQGYRVITAIKDALESDGKAVRGGNDLALSDLFVGTKKKEGEIAHTEKAIKAVQDVYTRAMEITARLGLKNAAAAIGELQTLQIAIGDDVLNYQPSPIKVKTDTGFDVYTLTKKKGREIYALSGTVEVKQPAPEEKAAKPEEKVAAAEQTTRYADLLYAQGLDDSLPINKEARETLVNNLTAGQLDAVMEYARGERDGLSLTIAKEKQGAIVRAITQLCNVNGFSGPQVDLYAPAEKIEITGRAKPIPLSEETLKKLDQWDSGHYLSAEEKQTLASRFSYQDVSKMIDFIDRARLAFSQGREPQEYLSSEQGVLISKDAIADRQIIRALNGLFLYAGGISVAYYESGGYLYSTIPTMYSEPEARVFKFPKKISYTEDKPGAIERWLNFEKGTKENPESDVAPEKLREITNAINSAKGGEIQFGGRMFRETPEDARLWSAYRRKAGIIAGYLNKQGIRAEVVEFSEFDQKKKEDRNGIKIVIAQNAMGVGEIKRKPNQIEATKEPSPAEAAKVDPLRAIQNMPQNIAASSMKNAILSLVKNDKDGSIPCSTQDQATRMRNWLIMNGGIPAEKLEVYATAPWEGAERQITSELGESTKIKDTKWMLRYSPEPVTKYPLNKLEKRGEKEPIHPTDTQAAIITTKRADALKGDLEDAAAAYEKANPGAEVKIAEFSPVGGSRKKDPKPAARENFYNESVYGDAYLGMAAEIQWRLLMDPQKAPAVGGYKRFRDALETDLSTMTDDGKFRHADQFAMMMLREWRGPGRPLAPDDKQAVHDAWGALDKKFANIEEFKKILSPENAIKLEAASNWLADSWVTQYNTKGMKAEDVETLRNSLKEVAWRTMVVVMQLEAGPAHYGIGSGKNRPQTPEDHLKGALLYMQNTEFNVKGEKEPRTTYFVYPEPDGVQYNILSRRVLTAGPNPEHYVTIPSKDPSKVILYGKLRQKNVQLEDGTWIPAYSVEVLKPEERKVVGRDSLGEASFTPEFTGPLPYAKIKIGQKPEKKGREIETRVSIAPRVEADAVVFSAGMEIRWHDIYLRFLSPKEDVFSAMENKPMMLENIVTTSTTPEGEIFILPPRHRQDGKGRELDKDRKYFAGLGGTVFSSAYVDKSGNVYVFLEQGKATPVNARKYYKETADELVKDKIEKVLIGTRDAGSGKVTLSEKYESKYGPHIFGSRLVRQEELVEEGSTKDKDGNTVDYRYRLEKANIGAHKEAVASGIDSDSAFVGTNIPFEARKKVKL